MTNLVYEVTSAQLTDQGRKRPHNEDFVAFFEPDDAEELISSGNLYIVADGVGGASKGERASQYAAQRVLYEYYRPPQIEPYERLRQSMRLACKEIHAYSQQNDTPSRMATTMVAAVLRGQTLTVANVGDSRAYLIRNGRIEQITQDHTFVGEMVRSGVMTEEEAQHSKRKNRLSRSLGGESDVKVDTFPNIALHTGDRIMLCSDGLTRYATQEDLIQLASTGSPIEVVEHLIKFANSQGGADNVSATLIVVGQLVDVADAIKIKSQGQAPTPVDWETMATEVGPIQKRSLPQFFLEKKYLPMVMTGVVIVCVLSVIGIAIFPKESGDNVSYTETNTPTLSNPPNQELTLQAIIPSQTTSPVQNPYPIEVLETPTQVLEVTETIIDHAESTPEIPGFCDYTVKEGDMLDTIKAKLKNEEVGYEEISCISNECEFTPTTPDKINPGWILRFPNILPSICIENQGKVPSESDQ
jgi:serine/threonine protein phosphatase PrpC